MKSVAATALAVIVAAGSISAQETQTAGMAWSLKAGDQFSTKVTIDIELGMELPGLPMGGGDQGFHVEYQLDHKVGESVDGVAKIDATIGPVTAKISMPMMGEMGYSSAEDDEQNPLRGVRHLVGKTFAYSIDKSGKVLSVSGGDALVEEAAQAAAADGGGDNGGGMMMIDPKALAGAAMMLFRDETLQTSIGVHTHVLPGAAGGASWSLDREESIATVGTIKFKAACASEDGAKITLSGNEISFEQPAPMPGEEANPMAAMQRKLMEGLEVTRTAVTGTATYDKALGRVTSSESVREIDQEGQLPEELKQMIQMQGGQVQDDMVLKRSSKLTVKVEEVAGDDRRRF
ncbi:MAG: hypothetical protein KDD82_03770 [Planctomycetes bacterium]|nr:hypothetical protein [Planctomycetota bacterium]